MKRRISLTFDNGARVVADMIEDEAPTVCEFIWNILPVEGPTIHGMYSGAEIFVLLDHPQAVPPENMVHIPLPGELLYFYDPGTGGVGRKGPVGEICFVYNRGVRLTGHEGVPAHASLFARVPGDWKHDWTAFAQECRKARWQGPQLLRIERVIV